MKQTLIILLLTMMALTAYSQKMGIRTNALLWATATPNIGVEVATGSHGSFMMNCQFNPFVFNNGAQIQHTVFSIEQRYWFSGRYNGSFVGLHLMAGRYEIGGKIINYKPFFQQFYKSNFQGQVVGGGISWGNSFKIAKYWSAEFSFGVGYLYFEYDKYTIKEHRFLKHDSRQYVGPTQLSIAITYWL